MREYLFFSIVAILIVFYFDAATAYYESPQIRKIYGKANYGNPNNFIDSEDWLPVSYLSTIPESEYFNDEISKYHSTSDLSTKYRDYSLATDDISQSSRPTGRKLNVLTRFVRNRLVSFIRKIFEDLMSLISGYFTSKYGPSRSTLQEFSNNERLSDYNNLSNKKPDNRGNLRRAIFDMTPYFPKGDIPPNPIFPGERWGWYPHKSATIPGYLREMYIKEAEKLRKN